MSDSDNKFYSFSELQRRYNKFFYTHTENIYDIFATFANSKKLQYSRAKQFFDLIISPYSKQEVFIADVGPGTGVHTYYFLKSLKELGFRGNITIDIYDFSESCLKKVEKKISNLVDNISTVNVDISSGVDFFINRYDLITFHEMLDDIPSNIYCKNEEGMFEVHYSKDLFRHELIPVSSSIIANKKIQIPDRLMYYHLPFNVIACDIVANACNNLLYNGYVELTDYGFTYDSIDIPYELWNLNIARDISGHMTTDINFSFFCDYLKSCKIGVQLYFQKNFCETMLNKDLYFFCYDDTLDYYTKEEISKNKELADLYSKNIIETDTYYYLRTKNFNL